MRTPVVALEIFLAKKSLKYISNLLFGWRAGNLLVVPPGRSIPIEWQIPSTTRDRRARLLLCSWPLLCYTFLSRRDNIPGTRVLEHNEASYCRRVRWCLSHSDLGSRVPSGRHEEPHQLLPPHRGLKCFIFKSLCLQETQDLHRGVHHTVREECCSRQLSSGVRPRLFWNSLQVPSS